eukprot:TRINITY_DN949_c0_g1_i2.p1 TRINITY_DN949_c0_g1~~TRINITY_DN949_c0_g1_i2.p1  ORF type:complete len:693 (+),score=71.51 TRINITY_DN949_c0_g1_i2:2925-5003(+)
MSSMLSSYLGEDQQGKIPLECLCDRSFLFIFIYYYQYLLIFLYILIQHLSKVIITNTKNKHMEKIVKKDYKAKDFEAEMVQYEIEDADYFPIDFKDTPDYIPADPFTMYQPEEEDEWETLKHFEKRKKQKNKQKATLEGLSEEEAAERCERHKDKLLEYICVEPTCFKIYCEKCKGEHFNHKAVKLVEARKSLHEFLINTQLIINQRAKSLEEIAKVKEKLGKALNEIEETIGRMKCEAKSINKFVSSAGNKSYTVMKLYDRVVKKFDEGIENLRKREKIIQNCKGGKAALQLYMKYMNRFNEVDGKLEEKVLVTIQEFIQQLAECKQTLIEDTEAMNEYMEYVEIPIILSHFAKIDEAFIRLNKTMGKCLGLGYKKLVRTQFLVLKAGTNHIRILDLTDLKDISLRKALLPNQIEARSQSLITVNRTLYVSGGVAGAPLKNMYSIDLDSKFEATSKAPMITAKYNHSLVSLRDKFIISVGGRNWSPLTNCERYSLEQDEWTLMPALNKPSENPMVYVFQDRWVYAFHNEGPYKFCVERQDQCESEKGWQLIKVAVKDKARLAEVLPPIQISSQYIHFFKQNSGTLDKYVFNPNGAKLGKDKQIKGKVKNMKGEVAITVIKGKVYLLRKETLVTVSIVKDLVVETKQFQQQLPCPFKQLSKLTESLLLHYYWQYKQSPLVQKLFIVYRINSH